MLVLLLLLLLLGELLLLFVMDVLLETTCVFEDVLLSGSQVKRCEMERNEVLLSLLAARK